MDKIIAQVSKDGMLLEHIAAEDQSFDICLAAVQQNGRALQFVKIYSVGDRIPIQLCRAALANTPDAQEFVPKDIFEYLQFLQTLRKLAKDDMVASMTNLTLRST